MRQSIAILLFIYCDSILGYFFRGPLSVVELSECRSCSDNYAIYLLNLIRSGTFPRVACDRETLGKIDAPLKLNAHETRLVQTLVTVYATKEPQTNSLCYKRGYLIREPLAILKLSKLFKKYRLAQSHPILRIYWCHIFFRIRCPFPVTGGDPG